MNQALRSTLRASVILAVIPLCSCELPPRSAWQVIRQDGLGDYLAIEFGSRPVPAYVSSGRQRSLALNSAPVETSPSGRYLSRQPVPPAVVAPRPPVAPTAPPSRSSAAVAPQSGMTSNVPKRASLAEGARKSSPPSTASTGPAEAVTKPVAGPSVLPEATTKAMEQAAKRAAMVTAPPVDELKPTGTAGSPLSTPAAASDPTSGGMAEKEVSAAADPAALANVPFGIPVVGRPGLINSPYAAKHQLVDVTGMKSGEAIKCPFSGKLMRVPVAAQAATDTTEPAVKPPMVPGTPPEPTPNAN